jgi:hypothetical protein
MYPLSCITLSALPSSFEAGAMMHSRFRRISLLIIVVIPFAMVSVIFTSFSFVFVEAQVLGYLPKTVTANI